jgi:hypothetical protein
MSFVQLHCVEQRNSDPALYSVEPNYYDGWTIAAIRSRAARDAPEGWALLRESLQRCDRD